MWAPAVGGTGGAVLLPLPQATLWLPTVLGANAAATWATRSLAEKIDEVVEAHNLDRTQAWEQF